MADSDYMGGDYAEASGSDVEADFAELNENEGEIILVKDPDGKTTAIHVASDSDHAEAESD